MERFYYGLVNAVANTWKHILKPFDDFMRYCEKYWNFLVRHYKVTFTIQCIGIIALIISAIAKAS